MSTRRLTLVAVLPLAVAVLPMAAAAEPSPMTGAITAAASDTTFKPEGSYTLNVAVEGQGMVMTFVAEKKADGSYTGVFRHAEMGEFPTTSLKVEGRKLTMGIETPGGPASVVLTVLPDNSVEGEWGMTGDGSKISGKKTS